MLHVDLAKSRRSKNLFRFVAEIAAFEQPMPRFPDGSLQRADRGIARGGCVLDTDEASAGAKHTSDFF
jgi:hypothetical protein